MSIIVPTLTFGSTVNGQKKKNQAKIDIEEEIQSYICLPNAIMISTFKYLKLVQIKEKSVGNKVIADKQIELDLQISKKMKNQYFIHFQILDTDQDQQMIKILASNNYQQLSLFILNSNNLKELKPYYNIFDASRYLEINQYDNPDNSIFRIVSFEDLIFCFTMSGLIFKLELINGKELKEIDHYKFDAKVNLLDIQFFQKEGIIVIAFDKNMLIIEQIQQFDINLQNDVYCLDYIKNVQKDILGDQLIGDSKITHMTINPVDLQLAISNSQQEIFVFQLEKHKYHQQQENDEYDKSIKNMINQNQILQNDESEDYSCLLDIKNIYQCIVNDHKYELRLLIRQQFESISSFNIINISSICFKTNSKSILISFNLLNLKDMQSTGITRILNIQNNEMKDLLKNCNIRLSDYHGHLKVYIVMQGLCSLGKLMNMKQLGREEQHYLSLFRI